MLKRTYAAVEAYLEDNTNEALDLARQMDSEDGSFDWTEAWDWDDLCAIAADGGADAVDDLVRAAVYGDVYGGRVRYNGYGNLESAEEEDLLQDAADYLTDIMNGFEDYVNDDGYVNSLNISNDLQEVIDNSVDLCYNVKVTDIQYDISDEDELTSEDLESMPTELILSVRAGDDDTVDEDELVDAISDETGWCILSYNYEILKEEE